MSIPVRKYARRHETRDERKAYRSLEEIGQFMERQKGHRPPRNYENAKEINQRLQAISPSKTLELISEYEETMLLFHGEVPDTRSLHIFIQAIALAMAQGEDWRSTIYPESFTALDLTDRHFLTQAIREMEKNKREMK